MKKSNILEAVLNKGFSSHSLTDWAESMFFNFIGGEYFSYPYDEKKYNEQFDFLAKLENMVKNAKTKQAYKLAVRYVISNFCEALTYEFDCSYSYAQKVMVNAFGLKNLETINNDLIEKMFAYNTDYKVSIICLNNRVLGFKN